MPDTKTDETTSKTSMEGLNGFNDNGSIITHGDSIDRFDGSPGSSTEGSESFSEDDDSDCGGGIYLPDFWGTPRGPVIIRINSTNSAVENVTSISPVPEKNNIENVLEDDDDLQGNNSLYCEKCLIQFLTIDAINKHNITAHSLSVSAENETVDNVQNESTYSNSKTDVTNSEDSYLCRLLIESESETEITREQTYKTSNNPETNIERYHETSVADVSELEKLLVAKESSEGYSCPICTCFERDRKLFEEHVNLNHGTSFKHYPVRSFESGCKFCLCSTNIDDHNKHIIDSHVEHYKSSKCSTNIQIESVNSTDFKDNSGQIGQTIVETIVDRIRRPVDSSLVHKKSRNTYKLGLYKDCIPKDIIFKCQNCSIHFLNCFVLTCHRLQDCPTKVSRKIIKKRLWTCPVCQILFRERDQMFHHLQHQNTQTDFKIFEYCNNLYSRILCKCNECNVYFEERCFLDHLKTDCNGNPIQFRKYCEICNIYVNKDQHKKKHEKNKWTKSDFIFIDEFIIPSRSHESAKCTAPIESPQVESYKILYNCKTCALTTDCYDYVVEHCQKHIGIDNYVPALEECYVCSMKCEGTCVNNHDKTIPIKTLHFDYSDLLVDENWFNLFDSLSKDEVEKIKSTCMYVMRDVKLKLILDGMPELTKYKCGNCKAYVALPEVKPHISNCNGHGGDICGICKQKFTAAFGSEYHERLHEVTDIQSPHRIVAFNYKDDKIFNSKLKDFRIVSECRAERSEDKVEFAQLRIRSNSSDESEEMQTRSHEAFDDRIKSVTQMSVSRHEPGSKLNDGILPESLIYFFQCKICKFTMDRLKYIKSHVNCENYNEKCSDCDFACNKVTLRRHEKWHEENKHLSSRNIKIIHFENTDVGPQEYFYYRCQECLMLFTNEHECKKNPAKLCEICEYSFSPKGFEFHMKRHNEDKNMTRDNIVIVPVKTTEQKKENNDIRLNNESLTNMYKCSSCCCLFLDGKDFYNHKIKFTCFKSYSIKCAECDLMFHENHNKALEIHREKHALAANVSQNLHRIITLEKANDLILCRCTNCKVHYLDSKMSHCCDAENSKCDKCYLTFEQSALKKHENRHHSKLNLTAEDFYIVNCEPGTKYQYSCNNRCENTLQVCINNDKPPPRKSVKSVGPIDLIDQEFDDSDSDTQTATNMNRGVVDHGKNISRNKQVVGKRHQTAHKRKTFLYKNAIYSNELYKCECGIHFLKASNSVFHQKDRNCKVKNTSTCHICGYLFSSKTLDDHIKIHHKAMKLKVEDFIIIIQKPLYKFVNRRGPKRSAGANNILFQCLKCNLCFLTENAMGVHFKKKHKISSLKKMCEDCGLIFTSQSVARHRLNHHRKFIFKLNDLHVFGAKDAFKSGNDKASTPYVYSSSLNKLVIKLSRCNTDIEASRPQTNPILHVQSTEVPEDISDSQLSINADSVVSPNISNEKIKTTSLSAVEGIANVKSDNTTDSLSDSDNECNDQQGNIAQNVNNADLMISEVVKIKVSTKSSGVYVLFMCKTCNVYFLTLKNCQNHLNGHTALGDHEYSNCKFCEWQFYIYDLAEHMLNQNCKDMETVELA